MEENTYQSISENIVNHDIRLKEFKFILENVKEDFKLTKGKLQRTLEKRRIPVKQKNYKFIFSNRNCPVHLMNRDLAFKSIEEYKCLFCGSIMIKMLICNNCHNIIDYEGEICEKCGLGLGKVPRMKEIQK